MDSQMPTPPNNEQAQQPSSGSLASSPVSSDETPHGERGILFKIISVGIILILLLGALNYFNILPLSKILPNYLGFLPRRDVPNGTSQAKQTLINFLPTVLASSFLPQSISDIKLTPKKEAKNGFNALWVNKEGIAGSNFYISSDSKKISSLYFQFEKIQSASPSVELAKSTINQVFNSKPQGEWRCKPWVADNTTFCEKFWTDSDETKKGLGFLIFTTPLTRGRLIFSACEHTKDEPITFSWKSCRAEFAENGVEQESP